MVAVNDTGLLLEGGEGGGGDELGFGGRFRVDGHKETANSTLRHRLWYSHCLRPKALEKMQLGAR